MYDVHDRDGARKGEILIPKRTRGRQSAAAQVAYQQQVENFCRHILEIRGSLDFEVSARGWCYILEEHGATKADFPTIERLFVLCRKSGDLPIDICAEDEARFAEHIEDVNEADPAAFAQDWINYVRDHAHQQYNPVSFWDGSNYYCEMWVEKIDLKSLFSDICKRYTIPLINIRGRTCLNSRAGTMRRFRERENEGKTCVLLYCGDHDPSGLDISSSVISDIEGLSGATGYFPADLIVDRFGLNFDFIQAEGLSWSDNLVTSSGEDLASPKHPDHLKPYVQRYLSEFGARKVEANARQAPLFECNPAIRARRYADRLRETPRSGANRGKGANSPPLGGAMTAASNAITTAASIAVVSAPTHDRAWWTEEAGRVGSDWGGIVESHLAVLAKLGLIERGSGQ